MGEGIIFPSPFFNHRRYWIIMALPVHLRGPLSKYTGYGVGFTGLVRRLLKDKRIAVDLSPVHNHIPTYVDDDLMALVNNPKHYNGIGVLFGYGDSILQLAVNYRILYTMYEATDIPFEWKSCVELSREVWVPSMFCGKLLSNYNPRIRLVPWGYDDHVFRGQKPIKHKDFVFGTLGVMSKRKGVDLTVAAYNRVFGTHRGVRLLIKTRDTRWLPGIDNPQITVIDDDWSEEQVVDFYRGLDCFVLPTRGEGIGVPPLQAAAMKVPTLVTAWSGPVDYIDNNGIWGIPIAGMADARNMQAKCVQWAEPDQSELERLMQWVYDTRPKVKGNYSRWTLTNMAETFINSCESAGRIYYAR